MKDELIKAIAATETELMNTLNGFAADQINTIPFKNSWTAGQVVDHVLKSGTGAFEVMHAPCEKTSRAYNEKEEMLKNIFLDFSIKMKSPLEILPTNAALQKDQLVNNVQHLFSKIRNAAATLDLTESCMAFEFPGQGALTRYEWLRFFTFHTQRHTLQLKNILTKLNNNNMKKIEKTVRINAPATTVSLVLTDDKMLREWYNEFMPGCYAITDWKPGSKIVCTDQDKNGMIGIIAENIPGKILDIEFTGNYLKGEEDYTSEMALAIKGTHETYEMNESDGITTLAISSQMDERYYDEMSTAWDKALVIIKRLAEEKA